MKKKKIPFSKRKVMAITWINEINKDESVNMIRSYRKKFKLDGLKAIDELQSLGVQLTLEEIEKEKRRLKKHEERQIKKKNRNHQEMEAIEQNEYFYYIAGYTSGGAAYGITWEEMGLEPFEDEKKE